MLLRIHHETTYRYAAPVSDSYMEARLHPWNDAEQGCADYSLAVTPSARLSLCRTPFAWIHFFNLLAPHDTVRMVSEATVITMPRNPFEQLDLLGEDWSLLRDDDLHGRLWEYLQPPAEPEIAEPVARIAAEVQREAGRGVAAFLLELTRLIHAGYVYDPRATSVTTPLDQVLSSRRGVCQDFAHLMIAVCRTAGIAARYVSGYLHVAETPETAQRRPAAGNGAMHAWMEVYLPAAGWVGFDPTHGIMVDHHYVKVAVGRCYSDVPPTRGVFRGPREHALEVVVRVTAAPEVSRADLRWAGQTPRLRSPMLSRAVVQPACGG